MKQRILMFVAIVAALSGISFGVAQATDFRSGDAPVIGKNEKIDHSVYIGGRDVVVAGTVHGDVYCGGQQVEISGFVEGDVICGAQNVKISGRVDGDVRVGGQFVDVSGEVTGSLTAGGQVVTIGSTGKIGKDATVGAADLKVNGIIGRDLVGGASTFSLTSKVVRDVTLGTETTTISGGEIGGSLTYYSDKDVVINNGKVTGEVTKKQPAENKHKVEFSAADYTRGAIMAFVSAVVLGLGIMLLTPKTLGTVSDRIKKSTFVSLGVGLLALILTPMLCVLLAITVVGALLAFVIFLLWLVALISAMTFGSYTLGTVITNKLQIKEMWRGATSLLLGLLAVSLVALIPFVGGLVVFIVMLFGLGGTTLLAIDNMKQR